MIQEKHELENGSILRIREASPNDAEELLLFFKNSSIESEYLNYEYGEFTRSVDEQREKIGKEAQIDNCLRIIGIVDDKIVSGLTFKGGRWNKMRHQGDFGICVKKKYQNMGVGKHMVEYLLNWARENTIIRKINLSVRVDNKPAIRLYRNLGFEIEGKRSREYQMKESFHDIFLMGLSVD